MTEHKADSSCFAEADVVFVGRVLTLGPAPGGWSGTLAIFQTVEYEIVRVEKGDLQIGQHVTIAHPVVALSRSAGPSPGLSSTLFAQGALLRVYAVRSEGRLEVFDENLGTVPVDERP